MPRKKKKAAAPKPPACPYEELLAPAIEIGLEAAKGILEIYQGSFNVQRKDDATPVTSADLAADEIISEALHRLTPRYPLLSEEQLTPPFKVRQSWRRYWLVDPLDGTREFIKKNDEFTVNIALIEDHKPVLGVIVAPVTGICYFAASGHGAFKQRPGCKPEPITSRSWSGRHITIAGSRSRPSPAFFELLNNFADYDVVRLGSSLKSCYVAEGKADLYARLGPTAEWDTAAAQCIVEEAGGQLTDVTLQPLRYNTKESLLNPPFLTVGDKTHDWQQFIPPL